MFHGVRFERSEIGSLLLNPLVKLEVTNQCHLDRLDVAVAFVPIAERGEQLEIVDDCEWRSKGPNEILFAEGVDAVFDADARVRLARAWWSECERDGRRDVRSRKPADHVEQRATANSDHVTVAVDVVHFDFRLDFRDVKVRVLCAFSSLELHRVANQVQAILANRKVLLDLIDQPGLGAAQGFVRPPATCEGNCAGPSTSVSQNSALSGANRSFLNRI